MRQILAVHFDVFTVSISVTSIYFAGLCEALEKEGGRFEPWLEFALCLCPQQLGDPLQPGVEI